MENRGGKPQPCLMNWVYSIVAAYPFICLNDWVATENIPEIGRDRGEESGNGKPLEKADYCLDHLFYDGCIGLLPGRE